MGYKCVPQIKGLVRGEPKPGQKHRANGKAILMEMGSERRSKSVTLDRSRSEQNEYEGHTKGADCWAEMVATAEAYRMPVRCRDGTMRERGLRADAVIGWSMIINPPSDMTEDWESGDYERFYQDAFDVMAKIEPRLFRPDNVRMTATHRDEGWKVDRDADEGEHMHIAGDARDTDGRYCGNVLDARLCDHINHEFPAAMRELGWELDDMDCTDWERMGKDETGEYKDPEYRAERMAKAKRSGRSTNQYAVDKARERWEAAIGREEELDERAVKLRSREAEAGAKERQAARRMAEVERREQAVAARERAVEAREAQVRAQAREIAERAQEALGEAQGVLDECKRFKLTLEDRQRGTGLQRAVQSRRRDLPHMLQEPAPSGTEGLSL